MGIILPESIEPEQLLNVLGDGDWEITVSDEYPDFLVRMEKQQEIVDLAACTFVRWVIRGQQIDIDHSNDPPYDHSGQVVHKAVEESVLLKQYQTLNEWLDNAYTGNSTPTYTSHYGLSWQTYEDWLTEHIQEVVSKPCVP